MPNYLYACPRHGQFEKMIPMKDCGHRQECPQCASLCDREFVPVAIVSDTSLFTGDRLGQIDGGRDDSLTGEHFRKMADRAGVVRSGKQYISQLADYPGDPEAWVDSRGDMVRVAKKKGLNIDDGPVRYKHERTEQPAQQGGIAEDLAIGFAKQIMEKNPGMKMERALEEAVNKHAPRGQKRIIKSNRKAKRKAPNIKPVIR